MKALVTGGLGFVGSHLVDNLIQEGHEVSVIDNLRSESSSRSYIRKEVKYFINDIREINTYKFLNKKFDIIYHLGALARIQPSFDDPLEYLKIDTMGTAEICEFARISSAKVVYAGSSSAYGGPMLNPYAFAKYTGEQICKMYNEVYNTSTVIARFFNVYGKRQPVTGPYPTVVGIFENQMINNLPLTVIGTGDQRRDFTHVSDIVSGLVELGKNNWNGEVFNLGSGKNYSINELANMFGGKVNYISSRPGEANTTLADYGPMLDHTGWSPKVDLKDYVENWKNENIHR